MECLTDCAIASFDGALFNGFYNTNPVFARRVGESAIQMMSDHARFIGILSSEGAYRKTLLMIQYLLEYDLYLANKDIARMLSCNPTTISRSVRRIKKEAPNLWSSYQRNKHRAITL